MIVHQRRHQEIGKADRAGGAEKEKLVVGDFRLERVVRFVAPAGQEPVDADRVDHGAGEDMRAHFGALLQNHDREFRIDLLQPDRSRKTSRSRPDDHDVEFHALAFGEFLLLGHYTLQFCRSCAGSVPGQIIPS